MTDFDDADLMDIGKHCQFHGECNQLDFLPFKCSGCKKTFCQNHRTAAAHKCTHADSDVQVIVCPFCSQAVRMIPTEDPNITFDRHQRTSCNPELHKAPKKRKCHVKTCKEKLMVINSVTCKSCGAVTCLRHRLGEDHSCPGPPVAPPSGFRAAFGNFFTGFNSSSTTTTTNSNGTAGNRKTAPTAGAGATAAPSTAATASTSRIASAKNRVSSVAKKASNSLQTQLQDYRSSHKTKNTPTTAFAVAPLSGAEQCPQCSQRFPTVQALIDHAASAHANGWASGNSLPVRPPSTTAAAGGFERCPHCSAQFDDPVALVHHVESKHGSASKETEVCVLS